MRVLSLKQPWAALVVRGAKKWEARTWETPYRGRIAIHASSKRTEGWMLDQWDQDECIAKLYATQGWITKADLDALPRTAVVGMVEIVEIFHPEDVWDSMSDEDRALVGGVAPEMFLWKLSDPIEIEPVSINGKLNLWTLPEDVAQVVTARAASATAHVVPSGRVDESLRQWRQRRAAIDADIKAFMSETVKPTGPLAAIVGSRRQSRQEIVDKVNQHVEAAKLRTEEDPGCIRLDDLLRPLIEHRRETTTDDELDEAIWNLAEPVT